MLASQNSIELRRTDADIGAADFEHPAWERAALVSLTRYYSGEIAPPERHAEARVVWTDAALCVRFRCPQREPLIVCDNPQTETKTLGLWEHDVCEIFVAPDAGAPEHYFEFEAAPTGEWLDLEIHWKTDGRITNWDYASGMEAAGRICKGEVWVAMRVGWQAFGREPRAGDEWRVNLFRCVGRDTPHRERGYLAWRPTHAAQPNFHVLAAFGHLRFTA